MNPPCERTVGASVMYYRHFGLTGAPFQFTPTARMLFMSRAHREALAALEWSLAEEPSGFSLMTGETGAGKTTLLVALIARGEGRARVAYVTNPRLGFEGIARDILNQLGVASGPSAIEMCEAFAAFMKNLSAGDRVAIIIDDAQSLAAATLEDLRLFAARADGESARLHFLLAGQPALRELLAAPELRQINERIGIRIALDALDRDEAIAYVAQRLSACGGTIAGVFAPGALEDLIGCAAGNPRRINLLCHNAMFAAWRANELRVSAAAARGAAAACGFAQDRTAGAPRWRERLASRCLMSLRAGSIRPVAAMAAMACFGLVAAYLWQGSPPLWQKPVSIDAGGMIGEAVTESPAAGSILMPRADAPSTGRAPASAAPSASARTGAAGALDTIPLGPRQVRVRAGDTLSGIAARYLGSEDQVDRLVAANPRLGDGKLIFAGEILNLPARASGPRRRERRVIVKTLSPGAGRSLASRAVVPEEE